MSKCFIHSFFLCFYHFTNQFHRKTFFDFSQNSICSPLKVSDGQSYRSELLGSATQMHRWLEVLYTSEAFAWYHGWTREMLEIFFR